MFSLLQATDSAPLASGDEVRLVDTSKFVNNGVITLEIFL
jgi:hypothetical protein